MATTFSRASLRLKPKTSAKRRFFRSGELAGLLLSTLVIVFGFWLVYQAKSANPDTTSFAEVPDKVKSNQLVVLNNLKRPDDLIPFLNIYDSKEEKAFVANKIFKDVT